MTEASAAELPPIPVVELGAGAPADLLAAEPDRAEALLAVAGRHFPDRFVAAADRISRRWLARSGNPYLAEIEAVAAGLGRPGAFFFNINYEWACTGGVAPAPDGTGNRLVRVLDWRLPGLGRNLLAARRQGPAGPWIDLTWPGFVGAIQGLAPGRFAAALNQAPLRRLTWLWPLDWALARRDVWRRDALPPAHLLRRVFDTARDYTEARAMLTETPLALPTIFLLSGPEPEQGCTIERLPDTAFVRESPATAANHWVEAGQGAWPRGNVSRERRRCLTETQAAADDSFAWLAPPVLNPRTRLAMLAEPATGRLVARAYESDGPVTRTTVLAGG